MFFYDFEVLDNFIKNNLLETIKYEENKLNKIIDLYIIKKDKISEVIPDIDLIITSAQDLKNELDIIINLYNSDLENNINEIKANLIEYNKKEENLFNTILNFEKNITSDSISRINIQQHPQDNNILIISKKDQKAYLPFFYEDVKNIFNKNREKFSTIQDVINNIYTISLSNYKNSVLSRFREAFYLIRKKDNGSISKALDLAFELMFKYELNPVIISACRNLDELDIYLDCLDSNETSYFPCFEIKFEITPKI